jgi:hypothetical protein
MLAGLSRTELALRILIVAGMTEHVLGLKTGAPGDPHSATRITSPRCGVRARRFANHAPTQETATSAAALVPICTAGRIRKGEGGIVARRVVAC